MTKRKEKSNGRPTMVAVIGYGSQGRAIARNLHDSGFGVTVGLRARSASRAKVRRDNLPAALGIAAAVEASEVVCFAFPDHLHQKVFRQAIAPSLPRRATLWLLHGSSIHFKFIEPPKSCDVILVAPHAPGDAVRAAYVGDRSVSAFYALGQNRSGQAATTARRLATGIGIKRQNLIKTTFAQEAIGDLFGEQAVLCGGLAMLIKNGFEVLVNNGWRPENAYLETVYQLDLIVDLIKQHGLAGMLKAVSPAARLGAVEAGPRIIDQSVRDRMEELLEEIKSGQFARRLLQLDDQALAKLNRSAGKLSHPDLEKAARKFRK